MKQGKVENPKKKHKLLRIVIIVFVLIGITGGILLKTVFNDKISDAMMPNSEANRLISYLGIADYEYTDKLGSSFTYKDVKKLMDKAGVSYDKSEVSLSYVPEFLPITRSKFESVYSTLIKELELDRLKVLSLYIYDIDHSLDSNINGITYELVKTNEGEFYMEKDYGIDSSYIGKIVRLYVSNNEIILCLGESQEAVTIKNVFVVKMAEDNSDKELLCYVDGTMQRFPIATGKEQFLGIENSLCDVVLTNGGVTEVLDHTGDLFQAKVTSYVDGCVSVEGYEEPFYLSNTFNVYKIKGTLNAMKSAGILLGYDSVSLYVVDGILEAALITEDIYSKNIRVVLNNSDYTSLYHDVVNVTSDTDFTISYKDVVKECKAGDRLELRTGSEELQGGVAKIASKEEGGRIKIGSIKRQGESASYRGTIEISKSDKGMVLVNELPIEEYLYGVVPSEMPATYEKEALKAQAICARAFAYRQMESDNYAAYGAHLDDSIACQVYNNASEDARTNFAVDDTYGVVPCYDGKVIESFFFSTSCGATSSNSVVWGGNPEPYLLDTMETELNEIANLSNEDTFRKFISGEYGANFIERDDPFFRWSVEFNTEQITEAINAHLYDRIKAMPENILALNANGKYEKKEIKTIGDVVSVEVTKRGDSGIIEEMTINGTATTIIVKGQTNARALLGPGAVPIRKQDGSQLTGWTSLPSAYFYVYKKEGSGEFVISGGGFGHGVGMSQNGANDMAKMGYTASDIIEHYFTAVELKDMYKMMEK